MEEENNPQEDLREIERLTAKLELDRFLMIGNRIYRFKREIKQIADRNKFKGGCGEIKDCGFWGERRCGNFEDLKHSDHYIYCPDCEAQKKIQEIAKRSVRMNYDNNNLTEEDLK